jgi:lysozyme
MLTSSLGPIGLFLGAAVGAAILRRRKTRGSSGLIGDPHAVPAQAVALIQKWEGFLPSAAPDVGDPIHGPVTIGYGTTIYPDGSRPQFGDTVDQDTAVQYMLHHIRTSVIPKLMKIPNWAIMSGGQRAALISFAYNVGSAFYGASGFSTITAALNNPAWRTEVPKALPLYVKGGGQTLPGLVARRKDEIAAWQS